MPVKHAIANRVWQASCLPQRRRFLRAVRAVPQTQGRLLLEIVKRNARTTFGHEHRFGRITAVGDFQRNVPLASYESMKPYVEQIMGGRRGVLTADPVTKLNLSSGTSSASKLLPFTAGLRREFDRGLALWLGDLFRRYPKIRNGSTYWVFTPMQAVPGGHDSAVPVGFDQDEEYFSPLRSRCLRAALAVPPEVQHITRIDDLYYVTLLYLLHARDLRWISVWNPSFLSLLLDRSSGSRAALLEDVAAGTLSRTLALDPELRRFLERSLRPRPRRAREISRLWDSRGSGQGETPWTAIWPRLELISCWADGWAAHAAGDIARLFPGVPVQGKGLLATEGFVTVPLHLGRRALPAPVLAVTTHFFEFKDCADNAIRLAHELQQGGEYEVIITTGGGLYRYQLQDRVRVAGFCAQAPCLQFVGKSGMVSDLRGEKLNEAHVHTVLNRCLKKRRIAAEFFFLAPRVMDGTARYVLYIESAYTGPDLSLLLQDIDTGLCENFHYAYCRRLGQLEPVAAFMLKPGAKALYIEECTRRRRLGTLKETRLEKTAGWSAILPGTWIGPSGGGSPCAKADSSGL